MTRNAYGDEFERPMDDDFEHETSGPEQKAAWKANQNLGSRFGNITPADAYNPQPKSPSRRDKHRMEVAARG